jgi:RNA polymerase sigma factor (sigma-70 family)
MMETMGRLSDHEVIERSRTVPALFDELFERHFAVVLRYLRRRVGDDVADDLTGELFVRAFAARDRYLPQTASALPWLLGIATNLIRMHRREEERRLAALVRLAALPVAEGELALPHDARIAAAIGRLPVDQRDVLLLHCWADLTHEQIAQALELAPGTSRAYLARARASLAEVLAPVVLEEL